MIHVHMHVHISIAHARSNGHVHTNAKNSVIPVWPPQKAPDSPSVWSTWTSLWQQASC